MRPSKKILMLLVCLALLFTLAMPALAAEAEGQQESVTILYTTDIHTYLQQDLTYSTIAAYKDSLSNALLVDAGDAIQGTVYGVMDEGNTIIRLMNATGYDVATLGNHEFDYGMAGCLQAIEHADFPYISCNFYHEKNGVAGDTVLEPYVVLESNGVKIAFIGITTPESFSKSTPAYFQDEQGNYLYAIAGGTDGSLLYAAVQEAISAAAQEADYVIALGHLGIDPSSRPWTSEEVIANTTGLDAFIDGHSHTPLEKQIVADKEGNPVVLTQGGYYFSALGQMTISPDGNIDTQLLTAEDLVTLTPKAEVKAIEDAWKAEIDSELGQEIGYLSDTLDNYDAEGNRLVRKAETNTGDFVTDALYFVFDQMGLEVDVSIMNGGGIRNTAITGPVTYKTCLDIFPFGNVACLQKVTGQQLLDALEWGAKDVTTEGQVENGGFLQVAGLTYTIDPTIPSTVQQDEKGVWTGPPTGAYKVTNVQVFDKESGEYQPLDLTAEYNLAGYNYILRQLGSGFAMFEGSVNVVDYVLEDYLVLAKYIQSFPNGKVTGYAEAGERITIKQETAATTLPTDVPPTAWYAPAVAFVREAGYMDSTGQGFLPAGTVSRGMVYQTFYNMAGQPEVAEAATFTDVEGKWYAEAAAWAEDSGLTTGVGNQLFAGDKAMTRQELAKAFADYALFMDLTPEELPDLSLYADAESLSAWAIEGMQISLSLGLLQGSENKLNPMATANRAELAQMLMNLSALSAPTETGLS